MKKGKNMKNGIENKLQIKGDTILMKIAMVYQIVMKMKIVMTIDF